MDNEWQSGLPRRRNVTAKREFLSIPRAEVIVVVKPGLADRHNLGMAGVCHNIVSRYIKFFMRMMRMSSYRAVDVGKSFGNLPQAVEATHPRRDRHHAPNSRRLGARDDAAEVVGKVGEIEMA